MSRLRKCRVCGCTEQRACWLVVAMDEAGNEFLLTGAIAIVPPEFRTHLEPCRWLLEDVCSAPPCVARAYELARELAERIAVDMQEAA